MRLVKIVFIATLLVASFEAVAQGIDIYIAREGETDFVQYFPPPVGVPQGSLSNAPVLQANILYPITIRIPGLRERDFQMVYNLHAGGNSSGSVGLTLPSINEVPRRKYFYVAINGHPSYNNIREDVVVNELYAIGFQILLSEKGIDILRLDMALNGDTYKHEDFTFDFIELSEYVSDVGSILHSGTIMNSRMKERLDKLSNDYDRGKGVQQYRLIDFVYDDLCKRKIGCFVKKAEGFVATFIANAPRI